MNAPGSLRYSLQRKPKSIRIAIFLIAIIELMILGGLSTLHKYEDRSEQALREMQQLKIQTSRIHALEWRAIAVKNIEPGVEQDIRNAEEVMASVLTSLFLTSERDDNLHKMLSLYKVYEMARDGEFMLIRSGRFEDARRMDIEQTDPSFSLLRANVDENISTYTRKADRIAELVDVLTAFLFVLSGVFIALLLIKSQKTAEKYNLMKLERKLRKEAETDQARLVEAIESSTDAVLIATKDGLIEYANTAFEGMTGYSRAEVMGCPLNMLGANGPEGAYSQIFNGLGPRRHWTGRLANKRKNGEVFQSEDTIAAVGMSPESGYVVIKRDLTEKLKLEALAEAVNTMNNIGYVFSGIRHEIGNPINTIKANLVLIKKKLDAGNLDITEHIGRSQGELARIEYLLRALKNFNMFETPEAQQMEIRPLMDNLAKLMFEDLSRKGIRLIREYEDGADSVWADPRALQQVLLNIATNAADAVAGVEDPRISFIVSASANSSGNLSGNSADSDYIRIRVADNGKGMGAEQKKELFKPFYTSKAHGTGLGLVLSKKMVTKMGGYLNIESAPGQGTDVDIFLPKKPIN
jgi:PAS domain S-box-containing protein